MLPPRSWQILLLSVSLAALPAAHPADQPRWPTTPDAEAAEALWQPAGAVEPLTWTWLRGEETTAADRRICTRIATALTAAHCPVPRREAPSAVGPAELAVAAADKPPTLLAVAPEADLALSHQDVETLRRLIDDGTTLIVERGDQAWNAQVVAWLASLFPGIHQVPISADDPALFRHPWPLLGAPLQVLRCTGSRPAAAGRSSSSRPTGARS